MLAEHPRKRSQRSRRQGTRVEARVAAGQDLTSIRADYARDTSLTELERRAALERLTEEFLKRRNQVQGLEQEASDLADSGAGESAAGEKMLALAREMHQLDPEASSHTSDLGVALYETGQFEEAIEMLRLAEGQWKHDWGHDEDTDGVAQPRNVAHIAMALGRLGRVDEAKAEIERLRQSVATVHTKCDGAAYLAQAEQALGLDKPSVPAAGAASAKTSQATGNEP